MNFPERRHLERLTPERLVYVDLKPDNGGIVLNLSEGGLCFQSVAPVRKHQSFAFTFHENNLAAGGFGEVVWTDESRKFAGLRFTNVSAATHDELNDLAKPQAAVIEEPGPVLPLRSVDDPALTEKLTSFDAGNVSSLQLALLREANVVPATPVSVVEPRSRKRWLLRAAMAVLVVYAVVVTLALLRKSGPRSPQPEAILTSQPNLPTSAVPATAKPAAGLNPRSNMTRTRKPALSLPEPTRPLLRAAPVRFEYPVVPSGTPSGRVDLKLLISSSGSVQDVKVLAGNAKLADASAQAARRWRYRPLELDGHPVEAEAHVRMSFAGNDAVSINFRQ